MKRVWISLMVFLFMVSASYAVTVYDSTTYKGNVTMEKTLTVEATANFPGAASFSGTSEFSAPVLTTPIIGSFYQDEAKTKLITVPSAASGEVVTSSATQTVINKTLTSPTITQPAITSMDWTIYVASHDFGGATGTWTLSATEKLAQILYVQGSTPDGSVIIGPSEYRQYTVFCAEIPGATGNITIKKTGGTGVTVAIGKSATVAYFPAYATTDYLRLTGDAAF